MGLTWDPLHLRQYSVYNLKILSSQGFAFSEQYTPSIVGAFPFLYTILNFCLHLVGPNNHLYTALNWFFTLPYCYLVRSLWRQGCQKWQDSILKLMRNARTHEKSPYAICGQRRPKSACAFAQADLGLRCPLTESIKCCSICRRTRKSRSDTHALMHTLI